MKWYLWGLLTLVLFTLTACADEGSPAQTVEAYIRAKAAADESRIAELLCAEMESQLEIEASSFANLETTVEGLACERGENAGDYTIVTCEGAIIATYGTEDRSFPVGSFRTTQEDGEWKICGEA